jgi:hypothetical protein
MCKMASFWHNPINGDVAVYDLCGHSETKEHLKLNENLWREGHYLPSGEIECRVTDVDRITMADCNERLRNRFPTFKEFLSWALTQSVSGSLYLNGCDLKGITLPQSVGGSLDLRGCDLKGITLPQSVGGYLDLSGDEHGYAEAMEQYNENKTRASCAESAPKKKGKARKHRATRPVRKSRS